MKIDSEKTLFLIDGSSFLYRAYYGVRPMNTSKGVPVQAVYGFCRMIKKLIDKFGSKHIALVWDSKGKTTRHEMFEEYKATRQAAPSDLFEQKDHICKFADLIGLHQFAKSGIEADDLMYSLAKEWVGDGKNAVIVTSDKDMGQAITDEIFMYDAFKETFIDAEGFQIKMGFPVSKAPFYFSLLGDASDNIPGVKGVGKKGALEVVQQFESLKDLYDNLDKVEKTRTRTALANNKDNAFLSEKLFLLQYHKTDITQDQLSFDKSHWPNARPVFEELEFRSMLKGLGQGVSTQPKKTSKDKGYNFVLVTTEEQLAECVEKVKEAKLFAYDTETDGLNALQNNLVGVSISVKEKEAFYIPCGHSVEESQLSKEVVMNSLKPLFSDSEIIKIAHHSKFDQLVLSQHGVEFVAPFFDTLIAASLVKLEWQKAGLKDLSEYYLDEPMLNFADMVTNKKRKHFGEVPLDEALEYAAADAHQTLRLYPIFKKMLKEQDMEDLYYDIELPLVQVLFDMEKRGIYCDASILKGLDELVVSKLEEITSKIFTLLGPGFEDINLNSPRQVEQLLFEHLKLPPQKKSAKRTGYSTDNEVLVELAKLHPIPGYIAQYRELFKLKSTYIDSLPEYINPNTKRIHTSFSQIRVATGRLASSDPNLQNIPVEGIGATVRAAFKPEGDRLFISADYSQIELRVLAHLSKDENLVNAFLAGHDIHKETAARIFGVATSEVTREQRTVGKRINFSILYGLTPYGLSKDLGIPLKEAKLYIDTYFEQYPKVRIWMDSVVAFAKEHGYVQTVHGRRRPIAGINEKNKNMFDLACRIAINTVAQGTAAEIMKLGMLRVDEIFKKEDLDAHILLQIHDEIIVSVVKDKAELVKEKVKDTLEDVVKWNLPLVVDTSIGTNWKEIK